MKIVSLVGKSKGYEKSFNAEGHTWCVSSVFNCLNAKKVNLIFQLHKPEDWENWIKNYKEKVIIAFPVLTEYNQYPVNEMLNKYGPVFGSTVSWMLALAIEREYDQINLFGLDMASKQEYIDQRDTVYYMIGRAEALGIKVNIPTNSRLYFKDRIYGVLENGKKSENLQ